MYLREDRTVSNNGAEFPRTGWIYLVLGGPGSGKNYILNQLPIEGKMFDLDKVATDVKKIAKPMPSYCLYNKATSKLKKIRELFFNEKNRTTLDNAIFVNCGNKNDGLISGILSQAKKFGYKVCLIFVATNRSVALQRNLDRSRTVSDGTFHSKHNGAREFINYFLTSNDYADVDLAFLVLSSGPNLNIPNDKNNNVIKLEKTVDGFQIPQNKNTFKPNNRFIQDIDSLNNFLGDEETSVNKPQVYYSQDELKKLRKSNMVPNKNGTYLREKLKEKIKKIIYEMYNLQ